MAITNNPVQFGKVVDLSSGINIIPNQWGLMQRLGLFTHQYNRTKTVLIPRTTEGEHVLQDRNWDERNPSISGGAKDWLALPIPHFPVDDAITPNDVDGNIDWASVITGGTQLETIESKRAEKMERIRRAHALTLELARLQLIKNGTAYAPNGTINVNYYTEFGISRTELPVDLTSTTVRPNIALEGAIAHLQDGVMSSVGVATDFIALCSPSFFSALTNNPFVTEQYLYTQRPQGDALLNGRLTAGSPLDARYRTFDYAGILFIEVRGSINGVDYIEEDKAYMFPRGTDAFETHFAPANRLSTVNQTALESYYFEYINEKDDIIEIMTETNFLNVLKRPELVVTLSNEEV